MRVAVERARVRPALALGGTARANGPERNGHRFGEVCCRWRVGSEEPSSVIVPPLWNGRRFSLAGKRLRPQGRPSRGEGAPYLPHALTDRHSACQRKSGREWRTATVSLAGLNTQSHRVRPSVTARRRHRSVTAVDGFVWCLSNTRTAPWDQLLVMHPVVPGITSGPRDE